MIKVIAVDGPAGAGKSTVSRLLAQGLGYAYLDTGAMYRAVAWALLQEGFRSEDNARVGDALPNLPLAFAIENGSLIISYRERRLGEELRAPEMAQWASRISQVVSVRAYLTEQQRKLGEMGNIVAEGRDMTTVVFPDAYVKIFLTADLNTRARRRLAEYRQKGIAVDYATLEAQIRARDEADCTRELAPLRAAPDALLIDTSHMDPSEVVTRLQELIQQKEKNNH
jgi:cytidylate kinase